MTADEYAKKNGFIGARKLKPWKHYACYEAVYAEPQENEPAPLIGFPQIILEIVNGVYRMASYDEAMEYISEVDNG